MEKILTKLKDIAFRELDQIPEDSSQLSVDCIKLIKDLTEIWKNSCKIEYYENMNAEQYNEGYSRDGYSQRGYGSNRMMPRYYDGNSYGGNGYNRGGNSYGGSRGGYSRDDAKHDMISKLENLMNETHDERDKEAIRRMLDGMR